MAGTHVWRASRILASTSPHRRSRRMRTRLWTVLHAPGLLHSSTASPDSAARMEDDYRRFAAAPRGY